MLSRLISKRIFLTLFCMSLLGALPSSKASAIDYVGVGPQFNFMVADYVGAGIGGGIHFLFGYDLGKIGSVSVYPNIQMLWGRKDFRYPLGRTDELTAFEFHFNGDVRYYFPVPVRLILQPYAGFGFAPDIIVRNWEPDYNNYSDVDVGGHGNVFGGIDFPIGANKVFGEIRGKFGNGYDMMQILFGFVFTLF